MNKKRIIIIVVLSLLIISWILAIYKLSSMNNKNSNGKSSSIISVFIEDALEREDDIHNKRLILCIKDNIDKFRNKDRINKLIERFNKYGI